MSSFKITGGRSLSGTIKPIGNKNAVLKMIPAALLTDQPVILRNVPEISDVTVMLDIMRDLGSEVTYIDASTVKIETKSIKTTIIDPEKARMLRASNMFLGPVLARMGEVTNVKPGGDKIGPREMNAHFDGFIQLGASLKMIDSETYKLNGSLRGNRIFLYEPSVTATENVLLAAVLAKGETEITNAATEPHVQSLCEMLNKMGAKISGIGSSILQIQGVGKLSGCDHTIPPDHIYIGTFIVLSAITGGELIIEGVNRNDMKPILYLYEKLGLKYEYQADNLKIFKNQELGIEDYEWARSKGIYSQPWPCFPTDMMSIAIVLATQTKGSLLFFEKMYPGRMFFANYLNGMGANIILADPHRIIVNGKTKLYGTTLSSPDLRAGMAYVAAGLCAHGDSLIHNIEHIERGYPHLEESIKNLGGTITKINQ
jgi:UDP-N-acetylglucosamine 1-carboxyvinyltransferase